MNYFSLNLLLDLKHKRKKRLLLSCLTHQEGVLTLTRKANIMGADTVRVEISRLHYQRLPILKTQALCL